MQGSFSHCFGQSFFLPEPTGYSSDAVTMQKAYICIYSTLNICNSTQLKAKKKKKKEKLIPLFCLPSLLPPAPRPLLSLTLPGEMRLPVYEPGG